MDELATLLAETRALPVGQATGSQQYAKNAYISKGG
ncbi:MAG: hypothetical protein UV64_C0007G0010 [Parcubacteria group bacterium GW2011_GWC1_43_11b]|nr:MAG: hypothetical protein UV64_C0007G0010 [Parcubacteria group bacterium GW2011_GWC1_43_11b]